MSKQYSTESSRVPTDTTRYLCAAAHLDSKFRDYVMEHIIHEKRKAIVIPYGVDIKSVVKYCLLANKRKRRRNLILSFLLFLLIMMSIMLHSTGKQQSILGIVFFLIAWIVVGIEIWFQNYGNIAVGLAKGNFHSTSIQYPLDKKLDEKLRMLSSTYDQNVVVYSGYSPFIGAGQKIGGWSFTIDISNGKTQGVKPDEFKLTEFYGYLTNELLALDIKGLSLADKLFVNGLEIRNDKFFFNELEISSSKFFLTSLPYTHPCTKVDPGLVSHISEHPTQNIRYYKCIQITSWSGEIVLSIFLRSTRVGKKNLLVEANYLLLTPLRDNYRQIDNIEIPFTLEKFLLIMLESFLKVIFTWPFSPLILLRQLLRILIREYKICGNENPIFDYGAASSLREFASSQHYRQYFQELDREMYVKVIENQVLASITTFLERKNVDISGLKNRQEVILNHGIMISGGEFKENNFSIKEIFSNVTKMKEKEKE